MVLHAGVNGELKDYGFPNDFVFNWVTDKLQTLDAGEGYTIPTLGSVFELFAGKMFINIELKGPMDDSMKPQYDCAKAARTVLDLVVKHEMHGKFLISSFTHSLLRVVEQVRTTYEKVHPRFDIFYLWNQEGKPLPSADELLASGDGINISYNYLTPEVLKLCRSKGKKLGVWVRVLDFKENDDFYHKMF